MATKTVKFAMFANSGNKKGTKNKAKQRAAAASEVDDGRAANEQQLEELTASIQKFNQLHDSFLNLCYTDRLVGGEGAGMMKGKGIHNIPLVCHCDKCKAACPVCSKKTDPKTVCSKHNIVKKPKPPPPPPTPCNSPESSFRTGSTGSSEGTPTTVTRLKPKQTQTSMPHMSCKKPPPESPRQKSGACNPCEKCFSLLSYLLCCKCCGSLCAGCLSTCSSLCSCCRYVLCCKCFCVCQSP